MSEEPIDLNAYRNAKAEPDEDCIVRDEYGRPLYTFLGEYEMGGKCYSMEFIAADEAEAEQRIEGMRQSLKYSGKLFSRIPV